MVNGEATVAALVDERTVCYELLTQLFHKHGVQCTTDEIIPLLAMSIARSLRKRSESKETACSQAPRSTVLEGHCLLGLLMSLSWHSENASSYNTRQIKKWFY